MIAPKRMSSGKYLDLGELTSEDVSLDDINTSLNYIYRFTGHHKDREPLTVAQHSALVLNLGRRLFPNELDVQMHCLMHDWPEAYYGDVATPLKKLMKKWYQQYTERVDELVYEKYYLFVLTNEVEEKCKICDLLALDIERRAMWKDQRGKELWPDTPLELMGLKEKLSLFDTYQSVRFVNIKEMYEELLYDKSKKEQS